MYPVAPIAKIALGYGGQGPGTVNGRQTATYFPEAITLDGKAVLTVRRTFFEAAPGAVNWDTGVGWISIPGDQYTSINLPGASYSSSYSYAILPTATYDIIDQFACSAPYQCNTATPTKVWAYDPAKATTRVVFPGVPLTTFVDHDLIIANDPVHGLEAANLATNTVTPLTGTVSPANRSLDVLAFTWPYLVYTTRDNGSHIFTGHAYDLQTQTDVVLPQLAPALQYGGPPNQAPGFVIASGSDTLFFAYVDTSQTLDLDELDHLMQPGSNPTILQSGSNENGVTITGATAQMIAFFDGEGFLWDRQNHQIYTLYAENGPAFAYGIVSGPWFGVVQEIGGAAGGTIGDNPREFDLFATSGVPA
jgi:hypothetical protein